MLLNFFSSSTPAAAAASAAEPKKSKFAQRQEEKKQRKEDRLERQSLRQDRESKFSKPSRDTQPQHDDYYGEPAPSKQNHRSNDDWDHDDAPRKRGSRSSSRGGDYEDRERNDRDDRDSRSNRDRNYNDQYSDHKPGLRSTRAADRNKTLQRHGKSIDKRHEKRVSESGDVTNVAKAALPTTTNIDVKAKIMSDLQKRREQRIGDNAALLAPKLPFEELGLANEICDYLDAIDFKQPTKIQAQALPALISGRDALIQAQTGSGKTLCYLLPVLQQLQSYTTRLTRDDGTQALILAPTRELSIQIEGVWKQIAKPFYWLITTTIMGGAKKKSEKARLRKGCHIVIGTPGRIVDHLGSTQSWGLGSVNWFILDEADRLFDLGFRDAIRHIYTELVDRADQRPKCALVSATLSKKQIREHVFELSSLLLQDPVHVGFDGVEEINDIDEEEDDDDEIKPISSELDDTDFESDDEQNNRDGDDCRGGKSNKARERENRRKKDESSEDDDDDESLKRSMLMRSLGPQRGGITRMSNGDSSSSSDSDSDSDGENEDGQEKSSKKDKKEDEEEDSIHKTDRNLADSKLLPRQRIKSMDHLQGMSQFATEEETNQALESVTTTFATPTTLEQLYVKMSSRHRLVALASFLRLRVFNSQHQTKKCKMIVFVSTCASVEFLHKIFQHAYWPDDSVNLTGKYIDDNRHLHNATSKGNKADKNAANVAQLQQSQQNAIKPALVNTQLWKLHGNMPQELRTQTFNKFCQSTEGILFSTDIAARGLDLPLIDWIVQYDPPEDTEDYIHRVGRTARIGHSGRALLFLLDSEEGYLQVLKKQGADLKQIPLATLLSGLHVDLPPKSPLLLTDKPLGAILQKQFEKLTSLSTHLNVLAKASYIAYVRAYAAYPKALKGIFHPRRLHLGEVAHSFALTETPSEITKNSQDILRIAEATINPTKAHKDSEEKENAKRKNDGKKSLVRIAKVTEKRQQLSEFM